MSAEISNPNNNFLKKLFNKNIVLAVLGIIALIALILFFQYSNKPKPPEKSPYLVEEEGGTGNQNNEPFSNIDIDGDGDEEQVPREIVQSKILMLTEKGELYIISPVDKKKELLLEGVSDYASSKDKNYIGYLKANSADNNQTEADKDIHIYNIKTKEESKIVAGKEVQRGISWSPDGRYIILERGTDSLGYNDVYSLETSKGNGCSFPGSIIWGSNNEVLAPSSPKDLAQRPGIDTEAKGIKKINIETCQSEDLLLPTNTVDYSAVKIIDGTLIIKKTHVDKIEDWDNITQASKTKTTYEKFNLQSKVIEPYPEYEKERKLENERLRKLVPVEVDVRAVYTGATDIATGWELVNVYKGISIYNNEIYLMGPDKTVVKIGEDAVATWL